MGMRNNYYQILHVQTLTNGTSLPLGWHFHAKGPYWIWCYFTYSSTKSWSKEKYYGNLYNILEVLGEISDKVNARFTPNEWIKGWCRKHGDWGSMIHVVIVTDEDLLILTTNRHMPCILSCRLHCRCDIGHVPIVYEGSNVLTRASSIPLLCP